MTRAKSDGQFEIDVDQLYTVLSKSNLAGKAKQLGKSLSVLAAAGAAGFMADDVCLGAVVYSGPVNEVVANDSFVMNLDGDKLDDFSLYHLAYSSIWGALLLPYSNSSNGVHTEPFTFATTYSSGGLVVPLGRSNQVSSGLPFNYYGVLTLGYASMSTGLFTPSNPAYAGVRFVDENGGMHYGWIHLHVAPEAVTVLDWAYEDVADTPIHIQGPDQPVPEPSSLAVLSGLGLLAVGAGGIRERRRRKGLVSQSA